MSKRGAGEREGYTPSQSNLRKARVEIRRVDAIQILMAAARSRSALNQQPQPQQSTAATSTAVAAPASTAAPAGGVAAPQPPQPSAPCTHCGTVLPVSADSCSLRQCCGCLDVFCSLCSVLDYEEREDRVFCLSCLDDQAARSGGNRSRSGSQVGITAATASHALSLPMGGAVGRWGQLDQLNSASPFPCTRTPQHGPTANRTPGGSARYSSRSHRGFSALLAFGGAGS